MPQPNLPLTPASSLDIKGQDGSKSSSLQVAFELPPPALSASDSRPLNAKSPLPSKPTAGTSRKRSAQAAKESFALPPPPTRSRKIIQMKPGGASAEESISNSASSNSTKPATSKGGSGSNLNGNATTASKKKQSSSTSAAGRKIARKTAHSLIERRRRSKMNEEFGILKSMIPACTGEMHKLAILQASIDYVRYLEDCVSKLKAQNEESQAATPTYRMEYSHSHESRSPEIFNQVQGQIYADDVEDEEDEDEDEDTPMMNSEAPSPVYATSHTHQPSISPALLPQDDMRYQTQRDRQGSHSSISTNSYSHQQHYRYTSASTSPVFGAQNGPTTLGNGVYDCARSSTGSGAAGSTLTSPALEPQRDRVLSEIEREQDQEATAALLMLNNDRRKPKSGTKDSRGMSVMDLLSS